jgi:hypothetical protein
MLVLLCASYWSIWYSSQYTVAVVPMRTARLIIYGYVRQARAHQTQQGDNPLGLNLVKVGADLIVALVPRERAILRSKSSV